MSVTVTCGLGVEVDFEHFSREGGLPNSMGNKKIGSLRIKGGGSTGKTGTPGHGGVSGH